MTKTFTPTDVTRLGTFKREIKELHDFIIERAKMYAAVVEKKPFNLRTDNGWVVYVYDREVFDTKAENIHVFYRDDQGGGGEQLGITAPRSFIFSTPTQEEIDYVAYQELKGKFEPKRKVQIPT